MGLHVNLTLGMPLSDPRRIASLIDPEGRFVRDARAVAARVDPDEARLEIGNQVDAFRGSWAAFRPISTATTTSGPVRHSPS